MNLAPPLFMPFVQAKLKVTEIAKLLKVSRVTVSLWMNGHCEPHNLLIAKVRKLLDAVSKALQCGDLPAPRSVKQPDRLGYITKVIAKQLAAMKGAGAATAEG
jgi:hypothetical protein